MNEIRIDLRDPAQARPDLGQRDAELCFKINHTMPGTDEYRALISELFYGRIGKGSYVNPNLTVVRANCVEIGEDVAIMNGCLMMAAGGIKIGNHARIAANVQLLSNNHDLYERDILICKPVTICDGVWLGAGSTVVPGVTIGKNAIVGAASVVTHDVEPNTIVAGNPARLIRRIPEKD